MQFMKAILFCILLVSLGTVLRATDPVLPKAFWYQIYVEEGNSVSPFTGTSAYDLDKLEEVLQNGHTIKLENLREVAITEQSKGATWRKVDAEAELLNGKRVTHITKLNGDPLEEALKK